MNISIYNINELGNPKVLNDFMKQKSDIATILNIDEEIPVSEFLKAIQFGETVYLEWDEESNEYDMIPFKVISNDKMVYVLYSSTKETDRVKNLLGWLKGCEYDINDGMNKLDDADGVSAITNHNKVILYNSDIFGLN